MGGDEGVKNSVRSEVLWRNRRLSPSEGASTEPPELLNASQLAIALLAKEFTGLEALDWWLCAVNSLSLAVSSEEKREERDGGVILGAAKMLALPLPETGLQGAVREPLSAETKP